MKQIFLQLKRFTMTSETGMSSANNIRNIKQTDNARSELNSANAAVGRFGNTKRNSYETVEVNHART